MVALRDGHHRDLAPDVARRLGADGDVPVTIVELVSPGHDPWPERDGSRGGPVGAIDEIAADLAGRDGVLVVIDAHGGGPITGPLFDDSAEHLLTHTRQPILVLGPGVARPSGRRSLLVPIDGSGRADDVLDATMRWCRTFGPAPVTVLGLDVPDPWPDESSDPVEDAPRQAATRLRRSGLDVDLLRHPALDTAAVLLDTSAAVAGAVLVVPGARSPGSDGHWYATARRLVRSAPCPVLVVPGQHAGRVS